MVFEITVYKAKVKLFSEYALLDEEIIKGEAECFLLHVNLPELFSKFFRH